MLARAGEKLQEAQEDRDHFKAAIEEKSSELEMLHRKLESLEELQQHLIGVSRELESEVNKSTQLSAENGRLLRANQLQVEQSEERCA